MRVERELDARRIGGVGDDERRLLRVEWRADQSRIDERSVLQEMLAGIGRMEATTREVQRLVQGIPARGHSAAMASEALDDDEPRPKTALHYAGAAAATLALLLLWWLRRKPAPAKPAAGGNGTRREPLEPPASPPMAKAPMSGAAAALQPSTTQGAAAGSGGAAMPATPQQGTAEIATATAGASDAASAQPEQEALELAEIMLSMGLASGAAQALTEHIRANPKQALFHWLKLLEIHRRSGNRFQFEQSSRELRQHFNIQAENWAQLHAGESPMLESYERVIEQLQGLWKDTAAATAYLKNLLEDNRGGTRAGFPQPVAEEILLLVAVLQTR